MDRSSAPVTVIEDRLVIGYGENEYAWMDAKGRLEPCSESEYTWYAGDETAAYYIWRMESKQDFHRAVGTLKDGKAEPLFSLSNRMIERRMENGTLYMQGETSVMLLSDKLQMIDATGKNAGIVAETNETRIFPEIDGEVTFALTPDGTFYLLSVED